MCEKAVLFDLDGTLNDSGEGIINSVIHTFNHFGLPYKSREELHVFIGPPLRETFVKFGVAPEKAEEALRVYRSRYVGKGMFECCIYDGIKEMLETLKNKGYTLFVATSKPEEMAIEIIKKIGIFEFFQGIYGATLDKSRDKKEEVLEYLLKENPKIKRALMIGDTVFDVLGAKLHNIPTVAVSWGYGSVSDMLENGAVALANNPNELVHIIEREMNG